MKQILQDLKTGETRLAEIPCPAITSGQVLIQTSRSLISAGTERMLVDFGKANWIDKARQQPDKVKVVLEKAKTDGIIPTINAVMNKLDQALPLGYCNVGRVIAAGAGAKGFSAGERVASNGKHAEVVSVPANLCVKIPQSVSDDEAAFTVIGAIALQGIRLAQPTLGESVAVIGLGLIGQVAVQLLRAHGCRVIGFDFDKGKLELARSFGAEVVNLSAGGDPVKSAEQFSRGHGVDAVIVAAATQSSDPVHQAALMCRKRGRIVLVGVTGLELARDDFYKKELSFQVSCSYGPGRYDPEYEEKGHDYPIGYIRWTEQRNFEAVLDMMADHRIDVKPLISHRYPLENAGEAYKVVGGSEPSMGILLEYPAIPASRVQEKKIVFDGRRKHTSQKSGEAAVSFVGAGNYAMSVLIPAFKSAGADLVSVASNGGTASASAASKFGFRHATTDVPGLLSDPESSVAVIATRHDSHADLVVRALKAGKHVFVEKPLCLNMDELLAVQAAYNDQYPPRVLMVGFNRRFAPQVQIIKQLLSAANTPKSFIMTINAGGIPAEHWTQDSHSGGGRIVGEACHFVDLLRYLSGSHIVSHSMTEMGTKIRDTASIQLGFADGSIGTIHYFANGPKSFPKERLEVFSSGKVLQLDNFRKLTGYGWGNFKTKNLWIQDKGQQSCVKAFLERVRGGGESPISAEELFEVASVTISLASGKA